MFIFFVIMKSLFFVLFVLKFVFLLYISKRNILNTMKKSIATDK